MSKLKNIEMKRDNIYEYFHAEDTKVNKNLLQNLFVENLTAESRARLQKIRAKNPVVFHITVDACGKVLNIELAIKTGDKEILTSNEVYDICKLIQERILFSPPSAYELDYVAFSFPLRKEILIYE